MRISDWSSDVCSSDLGEHSLTPDVYAAIRRECGGVAAVPGGIGDEAGRTPAVVAASRETILTVLKDYKHFTVETQLDRLWDTSGPIYVEIGRAQGRNTVNKAHTVLRPLLEKKKKESSNSY